MGSYIPKKSPCDTVSVFYIYVCTKILVMGLFICSNDTDTRTNTLGMHLYRGGIQGDSWVKDVTVADDLLGLCD